MKLSPLDRIFLFATGLLAAYQIAIGIDQMDNIPITAYTIAFGVLLVASLLLVLLGFEALDAPVVVVISTIIPLALSLGLVWQHLEFLRTAYLIFVMLGFSAVLVTRSMVIKNRERAPVIVIAVTHGIAGMIICLLPIGVSIQGTMKPLFALVGVGGALIGICGLLLACLKSGMPVLPRETLFKIFPVLLLLTTALFVAGFKYGRPL